MGFRKSIRKNSTDSTTSITSTSSSQDFANDDVNDSTSSLDSLEENMKSPLNVNEDFDIIDEQAQKHFSQIIDFEDEVTLDDFLDIDFYLKQKRKRDF